MENRLASRIHEQARPGLRDALEDLERVHLRFDDRQPRRTTLLERREHSRPYLLPELGSLAAGSNAARPHEMRRTPRCNLKLHAFFGRQEHPIAIRDRYDDLERHRLRDGVDALDLDCGFVLRDGHQLALGEVTDAVQQQNRSSGPDATHARVPGSVALEGDVSAFREFFSFSEEGDHRDAATVHHMPCRSVSMILQPARSSDSFTPGASSTRTPPRMMTPFVSSDLAIVGSSSTSTEEMMFARMTRTGAMSGSSTRASPSSTETRSPTPLRRTLASALSMASASISIATTRRAPSFAAAIESTALPAPRSATISPGRTTDD